MTIFYNQGETPETPEGTPEEKPEKEEEKTPPAEGE